MAATLHLSALLFAALWAVCLGLQDAGFAFSIADEHPDELMDIVLLATIEGKFHALSRSTGQSIWTTSYFKNTTTIHIPSALTYSQATDPNNAKEFYAIEPQSGNIYAMNRDSSSAIHQLPVAMAELVEISPFDFTSAAGNRRIFAGHKETYTLLMDSGTGRIKGALHVECPTDSVDECSEELELEEESVQPLTEVFIERTGTPSQFHLSLIYGLIFNKITTLPSIPLTEPVCRFKIYLCPRTELTAKTRWFKHPIIVFQIISTSSLFQMVMSFLSELLVMRMERGTLLLYGCIGSAAQYECQ